MELCRGTEQSYLTREVDPNFAQNTYFIHSTTVLSKSDCSSILHDVNRHAIPHIISHTLLRCLSWTMYINVKPLLYGRSIIGIPPSEEWQHTRSKMAQNKKILLRETARGIPPAGERAEKRPLSHCKKAANSERVARRPNVN